MFDLVVVPQWWGRFGVGPVMDFAESASDAPSKFSIGPAVGGGARVNDRLNRGVP